ncbi:MAG: ribonuclease III [Lachnospiraceae bacterium]|nr:ribonuclease III [Lachnospiraceae bacterium]
MEESVMQPEQGTAECGSSLPGQIMTESGIGRSAYDTLERSTRPEDRAKDDKDRFTGSMETMFSLPSRDWKQYSALELAYIGDAAYELIIRTIYVKRADMQVEKLHRKVTRCVSAKAQAKMAASLLPLLDEEETAIYRRGRNAKPYTKAKNATLAEYLEATGFEAVMGYLYLEGRFERMNELTAKGLEALGIGETRQV